MEYRISISIVDISANFKNIDINKVILEDIDIDKDILENIDIDINKYILENIDIVISIDKEILENIDIDKEIFEKIDIDKESLENIDIDIDKANLKNINIDKISNQLEFGISNWARPNVHWGPAAVDRKDPNQTNSSPRIAFSVGWLMRFFTSSEEMKTFSKSKGLNLEVGASSLLEKGIFFSFMN